MYYKNNNNYIALTRAGSKLDTLRFGLKNKTILIEIDFNHKTICELCVWKTNHLLSYRILKNSPGCIKLYE